MRVTDRNGIALVCLSFIIAGGLAGCAGRQRGGAPTAVRPGPWQAGMAEVDITPPVGYRMAGYFDERLSTGIHDHLKAKAMVLRQGDQEAALVFCDLVGFSLDVSRPARAEASRATGIPVTHIVVAATHSHTGPLFGDVRRDDFHREAIAKYGRDPQEKIDYPAYLTRQLVRVIVKAKANLQSAELETGITNQPGLPFNRRYVMKNGAVAFNPGQLNPNIVRPAGPVDSDVSILLLKKSNSTDAMGGLTVFAMHGDTIGGTDFSADYPYFIQQTLRKALGSNYISVFGAGTCGNLNHIDVTKRGTVKGFDVAERLGDAIGSTVVSDIPRLEPIAHPALAVRSKTLLLPLQTTTPRQLATAHVILDRMRDTNMDFYAKVRAVKAVDLARRGTNWPIEIQVFRLGADTAIVCLPAELFVEFGLAIKKASPFKQTLVITLCNDRPCYIPTLQGFADGGYEAVNSRLKPGSGEIMVETAIKMLNDLKRDL